MKIYLRPSLEDNLGWNGQYRTLKLSVLHEYAADGVLVELQRNYCLPDFNQWAYTTLFLEKNPKKRGPGWYTVIKIKQLVYFKSNCTWQHHCTSSITVVKLSKLQIRRCELISYYSYFILILIYYRIYCFLFVSLDTGDERKMWKDTTTQLLFLVSITFFSVTLCVVCAFDCSDCQLSIVICFTFRKKDA